MAHGGGLVFGRPDGAPLLPEGGTLIDGSEIREEARAFRALGIRLRDACLAMTNATTAEAADAASLDMNAAKGELLAASLRLRGGAA